MTITEAAAAVKAVGADRYQLEEVMRFYLWLLYAPVDEVLFHEGEPWAIKIGRGKCQLFEGSG